jgi:hypothetical protein
MSLHESNQKNEPKHPQIDESKQERGREKQEHRGTKITNTSDESQRTTGGFGPPFPTQKT